MNYLLRPRIWPSFLASSGVGPYDVPFRYASEPTPCGFPARGASACAARGTPIFAVSRRQFMKYPGLRSGRVSDFSKMSIMLSDQADFASTIPNQCSSLRRISCYASHDPMGQMRNWLKGQPDFCYMAKFGNLARDRNAVQLR